MRCSTLSNTLCGIYIITNTANNKVYIGFSSNIRRRWNGHKHELRHKKHPNYFLQTDWNIYGESSFVFGIVELCEISQLSEKERFYIKKYNAKKRERGYNITDGGDGNFGMVVSEETRKNLAIKFSGSGNPMYGKEHGQQTKHLFSVQRIGNKNGVGNKNSLAKFRRNNNYFGVVSRKNKKKNGDITVRFYAIFNHYSATKYLGSFMLEEDAAKAWDDMCFSVFKDASILNFPERYTNIKLDKEVFELGKERIENELNY